MNKVPLNIKSLHEQYLRSLAKEKKMVRFYQAIIFIVFFTSWELASHYKWIDPLIFSAPTKIFDLFITKISDGSLLFLENMISKMYDDEEGSRIAIIFNGSPLFTGDAGSGESNIRKWIIENDLLEGIIALPTDMFYNTGIATYIWVLTNRKDEKRN